MTTDDLLGLPAIKNHPNTDLNDLHLSDEMVKLLKSGRINNRLCSYTLDALLAELASFFPASHSPALSACRFVYPSTALLSFPDFLSERFFRPVGSLPSPSFCHLITCFPGIFLYFIVNADTFPSPHLPLCPL